MNNKRWFWLVAFALWVSVPSGVALAQATTPASNQTLDYIVAVVNERPITHQELLARQRLLRFMGQAPEAVPLRQVLQQLIDEQLQLQEAGKRLDAVPAQDVTAELSALASRNGLSLDQLRARVTEAGLSWANFETYVSQQLMLQRAHDELVVKGIKLSNGEVQRAIEALNDQPVVRRLHLAQVLVAVPEGASESSQQALAREAQAVLQQLKDGQDFATVARARSQAPDAAQGGDLGERDLDRWPALFVNAVKGLKPGELSGLVRSGAGWHILKLVSETDFRPALTYPQTLARHILIRAQSPQERAQARAQLAQLRQDILQGKTTFAQAAKRWSQDGSAEDGGVLGWANPGQFVPSFEAAMNALQLGQIAEPVDSPFGLHLIEVLQRKMTPMTEDQIRAVAEGRLRQQKAPKAIDDWVMALRGKAFIEMREQPE